MKGHHSNNFVKGATLSALACALVSTTVCSLASCGGGGGGKLDEDAILLRREFEDKYIALEPQQVNAALIEVFQSNGTNRAFHSRVHWGSGMGSITSTGIFSIVDFKKDESGKLTGFSFRVSSHEAKLNETSGFKHFWDIKDGAEGVVIADARFVVTDYGRAAGEQTPHGVFQATCHWEGNDSSSGNPAISGDTDKTGDVYIYSYYPEF